jgi:hypothetical protein
MGTTIGTDLGIGAEANPAINKVNAQDECVAWMNSLNSQHEFMD